MNKMMFLKKAAPVCAAILSMMFLTGCMPYKTSGEEVGVRTVKFSLFGEKGVSDNVTPPGEIKFLVPFLTDWHTFNITQQQLSMSASESRGDRATKDDILFKTIDGNDISLDLTITYKLVRDEVPHILQNVAKSNDEIKENIVRPIARSIPRDVFGELNTEDFYDASKRSQKAVECRDRMNTALEGYGIRVETVLPGTYRFNPAYKQAIEEKKVAEEEARKFVSATRAAEQEFISKVEEAKGEVAKVEAEADGEYQRAVISADAYFEQQSQFAKAIMAEGEAEAEGIRKMNEALAGSGGAAMVKLAVAEALMNKRIVLLPIGGDGLNVRTTDVNDLLKIYGLQKFATQGK